MFFSYLLCIFNVFYIITSAPLLENTFYGKIVEKCPSLPSDYYSKNPQLFRTCTNWETLNKIGDSKSDIVKVRCMLYFEAFTQYCNQTTTPNVTVPASAMPEYKIENICNATVIKNLNLTLLNRYNCSEICQDEVGFVKSMCRLSFYFATKRLDLLEKKPSLDSKVAALDLPHSQGIIEKVQELPSKENPQPQQNLPAIKKSKNDNKENSSNKIDSLLQKPNKHSLGIENGAVPVVNNHAESLPKAASTVKDKSNLEITPVGVNHEAVDSVKDPGPTPLDTQREQPNPKEDANSRSTPDNSNVNNDFENEDADVEQHDFPNTEPSVDDDLSSLDTQNELSKVPVIGESEAVNYNTEVEGDSYFFTYFMIWCVIFILGYVCYHNKQKILALVLEGRRGRKPPRARRPNSANYHRLDTNLEEAITSSCKKNTTNVIY